MAIRNKELIKGEKIANQKSIGMSFSNIYDVRLIIIHCGQWTYRVQRNGGEVKSKNTYENVLFELLAYTVHSTHYTYVYQLINAHWVLNTIPKHFLIRTFIHEIVWKVNRLI